ncbi:hypothetical protein EDB81DRAFT_219674 [Dactylonectria macrodidyma]|uniref:Uncharacterized protein n=1 Tax=Dactylonectria macrodidyma TaxID=307937 RepID=A0A9P9DTP9_9HYPO|nr:hypothetical protein EDB81DRAFT_219674 [Dactylonectria macrodidyma]
MDPEIESFLLFTESDVPPNTPHVSLELALGQILTENSDCNVLVTLRRSNDSNEGKPCILSWSQYDAAAAFMLFHHTPNNNGLRKIDIEGDPAAAPQAPLIVGGWNGSLRELTPGGSVRFMATLPKRYRRELVSGEKYELVWPGGEIAIWDWGSKEQHSGQRLDEKVPKICLPAARVTLEFNKFGLDAEAQGSPSPIAASERMEAPTLSVSLDCEKIVPQGGEVDVKISVLYEAPTGSPAITFHSYPFQWWYGPREGYRLYRRRENTWEKIEDDTTGFMIVDDPDVSINVSQDENFEDLQAGETWTTSHRLQAQGGLPDDTSVGDVFRYIFKGVKLDWWDWGDSSDHVETVVKLPCFIKGQVTEPQDNGGRPKLIVPASNAVEFTIAE